MSVRMTTGNNGLANVIVQITGTEPILRSEKREISVVVAREEATITHARYAAGARAV